MAQRLERSSARKLGGKAPKAQRKTKAKTGRPSGPSAADLRRELSRRTVELAEPREQQAATLREGSTVEDFTADFTGVRL